MNFNILWFVLIAVLYIGYFILEGFDMGVGILLPFLAKKDEERRALINTIGPHWDGNEVWLLTAGGATFAAFPHWYATLFSGFYLALLLMLVALIVRAVAFEFRSKDDDPRWRALWDGAIFFGSAVPALLWGVAFTNLLRGVPIDASMTYTGGFFNLLNLPALLGGLTSLSLFTLEGAYFLTLKLTDNLAVRAQEAAGKLWLPTLLINVVFYSVVYFNPAITGRIGLIQIPAVLASLALLSAGLAAKNKSFGWAFILSAATILLGISNTFLALYPNVMVSSIDPAYNLTIYNAASSTYTLKTMSIIALIFVPIVLLYQGWSYWVFRKRISTRAEDLHY